MLFDFAVTGKPVLLWCYDLAHFRDDLRGFTLDLQTEAPGPVLVEEDDVDKALADLPGSAAEHAGALARFRERWCGLDDGRATERVLDAVLAGPSA